MENQHPSHPAGKVQPAVTPPAVDDSATRVGIRVDVALLALQSRAQSLPGNRFQFGVLVAPVNGGWHLPSTHLRSHEPVSVAAARAADDAFGLLNLTLTQLSTVEAAADTAGRVFSIGHFCGISAADADAVLASGGTRLALVGEDQRALMVDGVAVHLPAGQRELVDAAIQTTRSRYAGEPDPLALLPDLFTLADLKDAHDAVFGESRFSTDAFRRVMEPQLIIVGERKSGSVGRPAKVYRRIGPTPTRPVTANVEASATPVDPTPVASTERPSQPEAVQPSVMPPTAAVAQDQTETATTSATPIADSNRKSAQPLTADVQFRNVGQRRWLDELLAFASASMSVTEDQQHPGLVRFAVSADRTNERAIEQVLALVDKCQEIFPHSLVDVYARRGVQRQRRSDLRTTKLYLPYSQALQQRLDELHDLAAVAQALIDVACAAPDQLLRFNVNQILRDVQALELMLQQTAATGVVVHDVPDETGTIPTAAEMEIRSRVPVVLNMAGAEAMAFRTIGDRLGVLAETCGSRVTRVAERIWFVTPA